MLIRIRKCPGTFVLCFLLIVGATTGAAAQDLSATAGKIPTGVRVCAGGDVLLGTNFDTTWTTVANRRYGVRIPPLPDPASLLDPLRESVQDADIILLNIEGAIGPPGTGSTKCSPHSTRCFAFRQPPAAAIALAEFNLNARMVGNIANNHSRDAGERGFRTTARLLRDAGVAVTGEDTLATPVSTASGDTVAFLGFHTSNETPDARNISAVRRHVGRAAARWPRLVVTAHIGAEGVSAQRTPNHVEQFLEMNRGNAVAFARTAIAAGAGWVVAHGPHVLRAAEWIGDGLAFYSLGNLVTHGPFRNDEPINRGALACATLDERGRPDDVQLIPTWQRYPGNVSVDASRRALQLIDSLSKLDFPQTGATVDSTGAVTRLRPER
ncbi:MAG: CapA family protein [Gemmatimonadaceae bacterium]